MSASPALGSKCNHNRNTSGSPRVSVPHPIKITPEISGRCRAEEGVKFLLAGVVRWEAGGSGPPSSAATSSGCACFYSADPGSVFCACSCTRSPTHTRQGFNLWDRPTRYFQEPAEAMNSFRPVGLVAPRTTTRATIRTHSTRTHSPVLTKVRVHCPPAQGVRQH